MTRSGSISSLNPIPVHAGQAPYGALKEKVRGSTSSSSSVCPFGQRVFGERLAAGRAAFLLVHEVDDDAAVGELQGGFHRVGQALADTVLDHETIHHHFDGVLLLLGELDVIGQLPHLTVDERTCVTIATQQFEQILEFALAAAHDRRENLETRAFRILQQRVHHLLRGLCALTRAPHSGQCGMPVRANSSRR